MAVMKTENVGIIFIKVELGWKEREPVHHADNREPSNNLLKVSKYFPKM